MAIQTRSSAAATSFTVAGSPAPSWLEHNRTLVLRLAVIFVALLLLALVIGVWANTQSQHARVAFNNAMDVYDSPLQQAGQPPIPNVKSYPNAAARAKVANPLFRDVARKYGLFKAGMNARYFAALTEQDMGDNKSAEADLKQTASGRDNGLAALAKMTLASLYATTGRSSEAVNLYRDLIDHPTLTVSANAARLALAGAEESTNPQGARELYAKVKDSDKTTAAGQIASQKLSGK